MYCNILRKVLLSTILLIGSNCYCSQNSFKDSFNDSYNDYDLFSQQDNLDEVDLNNKIQEQDKIFNWKNKEQDNELIKIQNQYERDMLNIAKKHEISMQEHSKIFNRKNQELNNELIENKKKHEQNMKDIKDNYNKRMKELEVNNKLSKQKKEGHNKRMKEMEISHKKEMDEIRKKNKQTMEENARLHKQRMEELNKEYEQRIEKIKKKHEQEMKEINIENKKRKEKREEEHKQKMEELKKKNEQIRIQLSRMNMPFLVPLLQMQNGVFQQQDVCIDYDDAHDNNILFNLPVIQSHGSNNSLSNLNHNNTMFNQMMMPLNYNMMQQLPFMYYNNQNSNYK